MDIRAFVEQLEHDPTYRRRLQAVRWLAAREARFGELSPPVVAPVAEALSRRGIERLYQHQALAIQHARAGRHVAVATGTASGKSLAYHVPALEALVVDPHATVLYLFPTKALAQDQLRFLLELSGGREDPWRLNAGTYDGDTPPDLRRRLKSSSRLLLTNPDMLHAGLLGHHVGWARFWRGLRYVVIDEMHVYRGLFGSHVANVVRRLRRIARQWGRSPTFILCSATIDNARQMAELLVGEPVEVVDEDGSPRAGQCMVLWNPPRVGHPPARRSANVEAAELMAELVAGDVPTIAFGRARVVAELLYRYARSRLQQVAPSRADKVAPYRGGYLPEERRSIERRLFSGELLGVCSTNALELGVDVGQLGAAILVGYPGSVASLWQQAGRAGRKQEPGLAVLVAHDSPIDQYLMNHPEYLFTRTPEPGVLNPDNPQVVMGHLRAAVYELPLKPAELSAFGPWADALMRLLHEAGEVWWDGTYWRWKGTPYPAAQFGLRTASEATYTVMDAGSGQVIGSLDEASAFFQLHPEAVYLHGGETYLVERLDLEGRVAWVRREPVDYFTQAVAEQRVRPVADAGPPLEKRVGQGVAQFGDAVVTQMVYMFKKVRFESRDSLGWGRVQLPPTEIYTMAMALAPDPAVLSAVAATGRSPIDGLWGAANAMVGVLPLFAGCDTSDVGAVVDSGPGASPAIFVYDRHPGGAGFARQAFDAAAAVAEAAFDLIARCPCESGCPSCVGAPVPPHSQTDPELSTRGRVPDKQAAMQLLELMLSPAGAAITGPPAAPRSVTGGVPEPGGAVPEKLPEPIRPPEPVRPVEPPALSGRPLPADLEMRLRRQLKAMAQPGAGGAEAARVRPRPGR
ncbi:MAG: DEAD/DEAH box helicase [Bacillota bacterium]